MSFIGSVALFMCVMDSRSLSSGLLIAFVPMLGQSRSSFVSFVIMDSFSAEPFSMSASAFSESSDLSFPVSSISVTLFLWQLDPRPLSSLGAIDSISVESSIMLASAFSKFSDLSSPVFDLSWALFLWLVDPRVLSELLSALVTIFEQSRSSFVSMGVMDSSSVSA